MAKQASRKRAKNGDSGAEEAIKKLLGVTTPSSKPKGKKAVVKGKPKATPMRTGNIPNKLAFQGRSQQVAAKTTGFTDLELENAHQALFPPLDVASAQPDFRDNGIPWGRPFGKDNRMDLFDPNDRVTKENIQSRFRTLESKVEVLSSVIRELRESIMEVQGAVVTLSGGRHLGM